MKKAFALVLAVAMIASMAVASFAAIQVYDPTYGSDAADDFYTANFFTYKNKTFYEAGTEVPFGTTVYLLFTDGGATADPNTSTAGWITDADAVKGLNVKANWEKNGSYVESVEIVKVGKVYALAFATTGSSLEDVQVLGEIEVKGKTYYEDANGKGQKADFKEKYNVEILLAYADGTAADLVELDDGEKAVYNFTNYDPQTTDDTVEVVFGELSAVVSPKGMKKVLFAYNDDVNEELYDAYIDADLTFINCTAAFRRTAEVTLDLEDDEYFYEVVDGKLVAVDGEYDEWTEEFTFKTRTLGNYVISDTELVVGEVAVANPSTGAAA